MSNVHISIVTSGGTTEQGSSLLVESSASIGTAETIASSGESQPTTLVSAAVTGSPLPVSSYVWRIANMGSDDIYVAFGSDPEASATGKGIPAGAIAYFSVAAFGDKVAVINV